MNSVQSNRCQQLPFRAATLHIGQPNTCRLVHWPSKVFSIGTVRLAIYVLDRPKEIPNQLR